MPAFLVFIFSLNVFAALPDECKSMPEIIRKFAEENGIGFTDAAREVVRASSKHAEMEIYPPHTTMLKSVCLNTRQLVSKAKNATRPKMLCGHIASVMQEILNEEGYHARIVYVYSNWNGASKTLLGHVYLEVWNKDKSIWEIQDPDYNLTYENDKNERITVEQLVAGDLGKISALNIKFSGWGVTKGNNLKTANFYSVAFIPVTKSIYFNNSAIENGLIYQVVEMLNKSYPDWGYNLKNVSKKH